MNGPAERPADIPPNFDWLGVYHRTIPGLTVRVHCQPGPPIWQCAGLDPDPDLEWWSGTVANTLWTPTEPLFRYDPGLLAGYPDPVQQLTVITPLLACRRQCQRGPLSVAPHFDAARSSPQTASDCNISHYSILITFKLHMQRIWQFAACPDVVDLPSIVNWKLKKIQSKTWTHIPTSKHWKTSQAPSLNRCQWLCWGRKHIPAPVLRQAMGTQHSGLPSDEPTKHTVPPVCDSLSLQPYPAWDQEERYEYVLW